MANVLITGAASGIGKAVKDYYLNITNPLFTNETDDIVTYLRKMGYEKELDRFK